MDAEPRAVIQALGEMKAAGKGVIGMKILGEGRLRGRVDDALRFALGLDCVDCFTIGFESRDQVTGLARRIQAVQRA
jgi:hypothetical protein